MVAVVQGEILPWNLRDKWASFTDGSGWKIGSLIYWAKQDGWIPPRRTTKKSKSAATSQDKGLRFTDTGLAELLVKHHGADLRYCHPWKKWLCWDGMRWKLDDTATAEQFGKLTVRAIFAAAAAEPDDVLRAQLVKFATTSESATRRAAMLKLAQCEPGIPVLPASLDNNPWLLNCINGTLDLRTGNLRQHDRADLITKLCPVRFDATAQCPRWLEFLDRIFSSNSAIIQFVQRVCGLCLTGDVSEQILLVFHGVGANGKSVLLITLLSILGPDYAMQAPPDLLMEKRGEAHPTNAPTCTASDWCAASRQKTAGRLAESLVKSLTGGDRIRPADARRLLGVHSDPQANTCLQSQARHPGTDHGIWRRIRLVPFTVVIPAEEQERT